MMKSEFGDDLLQPRATLYCMYLVSNVKLELDVKGFSKTKCGFLMRLMNELLQQDVDWLNELTRLKKNTGDPCVPERNLQIGCIIVAVSNDWI